MDKAEIMRRLNRPEASIFEVAVRKLIEGLERKVKDFESLKSIMYRDYDQMRRYIHELRNAKTINGYCLDFNVDEKGKTLLLLNERPVGTIEELTETWTDEDGKMWCRPTAYAYAQAVKSREKWQEAAEEREELLKKAEKAIAEVLADSKVVDGNKVAKAYPLGNVISVKTPNGEFHYSTWATFEQAERYCRRLGWSLERG